MNRIEKIQEYLAKSPADNFLQHALALEYIKAGEDSGAELLFKEILQRDPSYIGSYYHLGKLLERTGSIDEAIQWYERGMEQAKKAGDSHAFNELRAAVEELL